MACKHSDVSLVEMDSKQGPFLTVQCDVCGSVLPGAEIAAATVDAWNSGALRVARMDYPAYCAAVDAGWRDVLAGDVAGLEAFVKVAKGNN